MKPEVTWRSYLPTVVVLAIFVVMTLSVSFLCDDAFITFRYAKHLALGHGPVYNLGEHVEGYTNFLWMLLMAVVIKLGGLPEFWSRLLSIAFSSGTLLLLLNLGRKSEGVRPARLIYPLFLATTAPFVVWSTGGLETAATSFFTLASVLAAMSARRTGTIRHAAVAGTLAAAAILARPDAAIIAGLTAVWLLADVRQARKFVQTVAAYLAPLILLVGSHLLWRFNYYGHWLPNTFYVKSPALEYLPFGLRYLGRFALESGLWFPLGLATILIWKRRKLPISNDALFLLVLFLAYSAWVVYTGGDFMTMGRFFVPILPVFYLMLSELSLSAARIEKGALAVAAIILIAHFGYSAFMLLESRRPGSPQALDSIGLVTKYRDDWTKAAELLKREAMPTDTIATGAAGIIPYYTDLYTVDLLGLTSPDLSGYRRRDLGRRPGHSLSIKPEQFLKLQPQFFLGTPTVETEDSAHFTWGSLEDSKEGILEKYYPVSMPLNQDPRALYFFLRKDLAPRYQGRLTAYKIKL